MRRKLSIEKAYLKDKRALLRVDWNVPLRPDGTIASDKRIRETLPTIRKILAAGGSVIAMSHLGRPKGKADPSLSLRPVADHLDQLLPEVDVRFCEACRGPKAFEAAHGLQPGGVLVLENLRFEAGEEANDPGFAAELAALADIYVNDAFGASHRAHASIVGPPRQLVGCAGLLMQRELEAIAPLLAIDRQSATPPRPFVALLGGAKVSDKIGVLEALIPKLDALLIGGAMAYTFLKAKGVAIGRSRFEEDKLETALKLLAVAAESDTEVLLPLDHICAPSLDADATPEPTAAIPDEAMGLDIGPQTATAFLGKLQKAHTIVWNGPMGVFEKPPFAGGTKVMAETLGRLAASGRNVVAGGGETVEAAERFGVAADLSHVSTGGGAFLELLEGRELPGVAALRDEEV